ncbi:hypothetical protein TREMEDRAFT_71640 [Tremella mesenterica DSM 1558]|nr:uncharacterized protein TREMEDRAFT_71640 [Tremella mesenterica DSM 1558]EIW69465.1 hypothetical protein TREMEDRAFT_71640 [Tremella mesenterica DSM 1558]
MPSKVFTSSDEEEPTKPSHPQRGWLSDDYGMRKHPAHPPVPHISTSARQDPAAHSVPMARSQSLAEQGVRGFLRRASEHIPGFKRSDPAPPPENDKTTGSVPLVAQSTCPPQVDATPATASSHVNSTDLVHQLELTLSLGRPVDLARSRSLGAKVSFKDPAGGRGHEMRSHG